MFRRKKHKEEHILQDKIAATIAGRLLQLQTRFSNRMNGLKNLKLFVILFCLLCGSLSIFFIAEAILATPKRQLSIDRIRILRHIDQPGDTVTGKFIPAETFQQLQDYRHYMDSIGETIRPGLLDSMRVLEELYLEQHR